MSRAELERLMTDLSENPGLRARCGDFDGDPEGKIRWARSSGYDVTEEDVRDWTELSDDDLDQVAGGWDGGTGP